ncbi:LysR family transcriptional regulator [Paralcaligenes ureilyticus]|uniref:LysR family transcriptional regulator n=1 Tax=Paralcaligenes ureilyticus TaxID=627131 RepID=A0A4R3M114_9BURK|nr:LysR family transcriptional regulator [Paralcaligenes ureilyticus]TCT04807.1 LysR family transcriptional regulator [Paralcaligenes ureilyticus]
MEDLNDLYYFAQVVEHRGFAPAGRALNMPKSKLSRRISQLEERLGVRLIQRSTRHFFVTELGQEYYRHCVAMLIEAEAAAEAVQRMQSEPQGIVRMSCPTTLLHYCIGELVGRFMVENPRVQVHLDAANRQADVLGEGLDLALRVRFPPLESSDLVMRVLADSPQRLVASPRLSGALKSRLTPADLSGLPSMDWRGSQHDHLWRLNGPNGAIAEVPHHPRYITEDMTALRQAALLGIGVVQLPCMVVEKDLQEGRLVDIIPDWTPQGAIVHAVFPSRRGLLPSVRTLIDFLADHIQK